MLTGYQCEVVAFQTDGALICPECATKRYGEARVAATERGLGYGDISPLIRYSLDEWEGERVYELARERLSDFVFDHPHLASLFGVTPNSSGSNEWRVLDKLAERFEELGKEHCEDCGEALNA